MREWTKITPIHLPFMVWFDRVLNFNFHLTNQHHVQVPILFISDCLNPGTG